MNEPRWNLSVRFDRRTVETHPVTSDRRPFVQPYRNDHELERTMSRLLAEVR